MNFLTVLVKQLLHEDDIPTLQEYMGYCLIPSNKGQQMLFLVGKGGEGKSRVGLVMRVLLGDNMCNGSIFSGLSTMERSLTMSAKRKDKKGRVLRTGESQRKDLTYQYRYQDISGKRRTVYAPTLEELRAKEDEINKAQDSGVDYAGKGA